jgi:hypothetical protein
MLVDLVSALPVPVAFSLVWLTSSGVTSPAPQAMSGSTADTLTGAQRALVVERVSAIVGEHYLLPDMASELAAHVKKRWHDGAYSSLASMRELTDQLTSDLRSISGDKHLSLDLGRDVAITTERMRHRRQQLAEINYGFNTVDRLPGNVGYLQIVELCPFDAAGEAMRRSFASLAGSDAVIIDLRENEGGSGDLVPPICGYFLPARTHLYDILNPRNGEAEKVSTPKEIDSPRMTETPVYVLIGRRTYSAAECLAYTLQSHAKAVIVGERSVGGAHPTRSFVIREAEVVVTVPVRDIINPLTGTNWEGGGVKPDLDVPADRALRIAHEHALKRMKAAARPDGSDRPSPGLPSRYSRRPSSSSILAPTRSATGGS